MWAGSRARARGLKSDTLSFFDLRMATAARVGLRPSCQSSTELSESAAADGEVRVAGRLVDCFATTTGKLPKSHFVRVF